MARKPSCAGTMEPDAPAVVAAIVSQEVGKNCHL